MVLLGVRLSCSNVTLYQFHLPMLQHGFQQLLLLVSIYSWSLQSSRQPYKPLDPLGVFVRRRRRPVREADSGRGCSIFSRCSFFFSIEECLGSTAGANGHRIRSRGGILRQSHWHVTIRAPCFDMLLWLGVALHLRSATHDKLMS